MKRLLLLSAFFVAVGYWSSTPVRATRLPMQIKTVPSTALSRPTPSGGTHDYLVWWDKTGKKFAEIQTTSVASHLTRPSSFVGTDQDWAETWNRGDVNLTKGHPNLNTPSKDYERGSVAVNPDGSLLIFTGDQYLEPRMKVPAGKFTGSVNNLTTIASTECITIVAGVISGTPLAKCIDNQ